MSLAEYNIPSKMDPEDVELEKLLSQIMGSPEEFLEYLKATRETNNNVIVAESDSYSTGEEP